MIVNHLRYTGFNAYMYTHHTISQSLGEYFSNDCYYKGIFNGAVLYFVGFHVRIFILAYYYACKLGLFKR